MLTFDVGQHLDRIFGNLADALPSMTDGDESFTFTRDRLPAPPTVMTTEHLVIRKFVHDYDGCHREDGVSFFFGSRRTVRELGLLALAVLFHPEPATTELLLPNPHSEVRRLRVRYEHPVDQDPVWYFATPTKLVYWPEDTQKHPAVFGPPRSDRLELRLTTQDELGGATDKEWAARDTLVGFGSEHATLWFADLLLNAGAETNRVTEYELESEAGFGGVSPLSVEVKLVMPEDEFYRPLEYFA